MTYFDTGTHGGDGWPVLDMTCYAGKPGVYDIGARLGVTDQQDIARDSARRRALGSRRRATRKRRDRSSPRSVRVQFADGSTGLHDAGTRTLPCRSPLAAVINVGTELAELLVITAI